jgi:hypothetical protein
MNADVLTTKVDDGIAVISLGSAKQIYLRCIRRKRSLTPNASFEVPQRCLYQMAWRSNAISSANEYRL